MSASQVSALVVWHPFSNVAHVTSHCGQVSDQEVHRRLRTWHRQPLQARGAHRIRAGKLLNSRPMLPAGLHSRLGNIRHSGHFA